MKKGGAIASDRPLVLTGALRDSLKVINRSARGFVYGTNLKGKGGFPYPGIHQVGSAKNNLPARRWLFLTNGDLQQMVKMTIDHIRGAK